MRDYLIETKKLTKLYGDQAAVKDVDLHVKKGRIYGLLGRNGAGKTTIMKMILGLTPITSGEVDVFGRNIKGREKRVYPRIGAIIETPGFYPAPKTLRSLPNCAARPGRTPSGTRWKWWGCPTGTKSCSASIPLA